MTRSAGLKQSMRVTDGQTELPWQRWHTRILPRVKRKEKELEKQNAEEI